MSKLMLIANYVLTMVLFVSLQVLSATLLWNAFAPRMLNVPRANPLQMAGAILFYLVFTGKFWGDVARFLDRRKRKRSQT